MERDLGRRTHKGPATAARSYSIFQSAELSSAVPLRPPWRLHPYLTALLGHFTTLSHLQGPFVCSGVMQKYQLSAGGAGTIVAAMAVGA